MKPRRAGVRSRRWRWLACAIVLQTVCACSAIAPREKLAIQTYQLDYEPPAITGDSLPVVLQVAPFRIAAAYDREAILYRDSRYQTNTYFYHRWAAHPAKMLTDLITRDLASSQHYAAAQQGPSLLPADYVLQADIEQIEEQPAGERCAAHLRLNIVVARLRTLNRPVVFQNAYDFQESCACNQPDDLAAAMSRAVAALSQQLQSELANAIATDLDSKPRT